MNDEKVLLRALTPRNLLSFGPKTEPIPLMALNVLIGPNGSGKSNFIEVVTLLRAAPRDLRGPISRGGGVTEWIWKGDPKAEASLDVVVANPKGTQSLRHKLSFGVLGQAFQLADESIENEVPHPGEVDAYFYYRYQHGRPYVNVKGEQRRLMPDSVEPDRSILAQRREPETYPELTYLAGVYEKMRVYREWSFGRHAVFREPQKADMRNDRLEEDFSNLGLFLNRLGRNAKARTAILAALKDLYEGIDGYRFQVEGGTVQVFFNEGEFDIPATRLSDGTVRYLCLLAILCDPEPPPLICIEEPELGLHPDILPKLADLLVAASERTQLIVTTHSDILVDALTEVPEVVLVCEKHAGQTVMRRLKRGALEHWLENYRLGELWTRGELGGTRW
jgi:predicted ATPase